MNFFIVTLVYVIEDFKSSEDVQNSAHQRGRGHQY
jgi:hypothetical protein